MCKGTWVCFFCRVAVRRDTWRLVTHVHPELIGSTDSDKVRCPQCSKASVFLGPSITIPPKRDLRGWKRLKESVLQFQQELTVRSKKDSTVKKHALEQRIIDLESRGDDVGRLVLIKSLKKELTD